jgi:hypothetical protein
MVSSSMLQVVISGHAQGGPFLPISMLEVVNSSHFPDGQIQPFSKKFQLFSRWSVPAIVVCLVNFPGGLLQPFSMWSTPAIF